MFNPDCKTPCNRHIVQIPLCTSSICQNALFCNRNAHMCVRTQTDAFWDICLMHCGICGMGLLISNMSALSIVVWYQSDIIVQETSWYLGYINSLRLSDIMALLVLGNIVSNNGLSPVWCQAITWTNVDFLTIGPLVTNFILISIKTQAFSFKKMFVKMLSDIFFLVSMS